MNWQPAFVTAVAVMASVGSGCDQPTHGQSLSGPAGDQLRAIATALRSDGVGKIEVLHIPLDLETFGDITPTTLQNNWHYKTTIRDLAAIASRDALAAGLVTASVRLGSGPVDLRQGLVFYSTKDDAPLGAIYFDLRTAHSGFVNNNQVTFETRLLSRLRGILPLSLEQAPQWSLR